MYMELFRHVSSRQTRNPLIYRPYHIPIETDMSVQLSKSGRARQIK